MSKSNISADIDENLLLFSSNFIKQREYWEKKLSGETTGTCLLSHVKRKKPAQKANANVDIIFPTTVCDQLLKLSKHSDLSIYIILLTTLKILLYRYGDNEDIIILSPIYPANVSEETINHWLMIRDRLNPAMTVKDFILQVRQSVLGAYENQDYPWKKLVDDLLPAFSSGTPGMSGSFVTNVVCFFEGLHEHNQRLLEEIPDRLVFSFREVEGQNRVKGEISYDANIFEKYYIHQLAGHFLKILEGIIFHIDSRVRDISILSAEERKRLLEDFNGKKSDYPCDNTLHELFQHQAEKVPDRIALMGRNSKSEIRNPKQIQNSNDQNSKHYVTYRGLNEKSDQLAWLLKDKGVQADTIVGIMVERSVEMVVGIFGILKAGAAYLPIDPGYPGERIKYMLEDSAANVLLTVPGLSEKFKKLSIVNCQLLIINEKPPNCRRLNKPPKEANSINNYQLTINNLQLESANLAYLIYTSGSTGKPKGVMVGHSCVVNRLYWLQGKYHLNETDVILQKTPLTFDVSVCELFRWIPGGGRLCLLDANSETDMEKIIATIAANKATTADFVPSMLNIFLDYLEVDDCWDNVSSLRWVFVGVEPVSRKLAIKFNKTLNKRYGTSLINAYGLTEATVDNTHFDCSKMSEFEAAQTVPIGKPMNNTKIYILNRDSKIQPVGVPGEICIFGESLARGYLNQPGLNREKFVENPFEPGKRMFKTGDFASWLPDGNISFIGRKDFQVKIRGNRVELGEIEDRLLAIDFIKEAVVIEREPETPGPGENKDLFLCAYIVPAGDVDISQLRDILAASLPGYMVPAYFIRLNSIPLTPNGKVNRALLPAPAVEPGIKYTAPRDAVEKKLVDLWSKILGTQKNIIGIDANFFELGGHSLKATILMSKIHKAFNVRISLEEIFSYPTVRGLARCLKGLVEDRYQPITPVEKKEYYLISSAQKRLYIQQQMKPGNVNYNLPIYISLEGKLERSRLEAVFQQLVRRHESLRTSFEVVGNEAVQRVQDEVELEMENFQVEVKVKEKMVPFGQINAFGGREGTEGTGGLAPLFSKSFIRPFDLSQAPLLRVGLIELENQKHILMVDMHHIITDGISLGILSREFMQLYDGKTLAGLNVQYKDFSEWQHRLLKTKEIENQETYWLNQFGEDIPVLDIPTDYPRSDARNFEGEYFIFEIPGELVPGIKKLEQETETTLHMVLLAVYTILLSKYSGQEEIVVGTGIAGRQHADLENVIGLFINMLGIRNRPVENKSFIQFLEEVKENALKAYANQDYQFETLVQKLNLQGNPSRNPLFDVVFQTQNIEIPQIQVKGLTFKPYEREFQVSHFDLVIYCDEEAQSESIDLRLLYSPGLFKRSTIEEMANHFVEILAQVLENREMKLKDIKISMEVSAARSKLHQEKVQFQF